MLSSGQKLTVYLLMLAVPLAICAISSFAQSDRINLPSVGELRAAPFEKTTAPNSGNTFSYADLESTVTLCKAYARGADLLPQYHEPVLTRGATGIAIFKNISPSVVLVVTGNFKNEKLSELGIGAGVIVDSSGYVLTNWHVIAGYQAGVIFLKPTLGTDISQTPAYGARLIAQDPGADLALLKIVKPPAGLRAVPIADISSAQIAEDIHIIGHPHGNLWSYSTGVISQVRDGYTWSYSDGSKHQAKVIQMQTAINPGNSGGPVLDDSGRILGLVAMSEEGQNLNYAVAADVIKGFIASALQSKTRGASPKTTSPNPQYSTLSMQDGRTVIRAVYPDAVTYSITDVKGQPLGLVAEASDGTTMEAWSPNPLGGFSYWWVRLPNGKSVSAQASGAILDRFGGSPAARR